MEVSQRGFRALAEFRYQIRAFLKFSEDAAKAAGLEPQQHQLMLVVKAAEPESLSIGQVAERLLVEHHSAVGLVDRSEQADLVHRIRSPLDRRSVDLRLTPKGSRILKKLSAHHQRELRSLVPALITNLNIIQRKAPGSEAESSQVPEARPRRARFARVIEESGKKNCLTGENIPPPKSSETLPPRRAYSGSRH